MDAARLPIETIDKVIAGDLNAWEPTGDLKDEACKDWDYLESVVLNIYKEDFIKGCPKSRPEPHFYKDMTDDEYFEVFYTIYE